MLNARYLANLSDDIVKLYADLEFEIKKDIFKRLNKLRKVTDATIYQMEIIQETGALKKDIIKIVDTYNLKMRRELVKLYNEAMGQATKKDLQYYQFGKAELSENQTQVINSSIDKLLADAHPVNVAFDKQSQKFEEIYNSLVRITMTVADATEKKFIKQANIAYMKVATGGASWQDAYKVAVNNLAKDGVKSVIYTGSGKLIERSIESATRMNILTGINQTASQQTIENADELNTDLVEVDAHIGARPEHEEWQGKVYCLNGERDFYDSDGIKRHAYDFYKVCRFGEADGICGINCRHSFYPYFEGTPLQYSRNELDEMSEKKVKLDNHDITPYEAEQELRLCERAIRAYKNEVMGYELTGLTDTKEYITARNNLYNWQANARHITEETKIKRHYINEYIGTKDGKQPTGLKPKL